MLDSWKIFFSYCLAVTAATIPYVMLIMLRGISNFELATTYLAETKTQHFIEMSIFALFACLDFCVYLRGAAIFYRNCNC